MKEFFTILFCILGFIVLLDVFVLLLIHAHRNFEIEHHELSVIEEIIKMLEEEKLQREKRRSMRP